MQRLNVQVAIPVDNPKYPKFVRNEQIDRIDGHNLERITRSNKRYDSTVDERERNYQTRKPEPRFSEYR